MLIYCVGNINYIEQIRCIDSELCSEKGTMVVITDQGSGPGDFIMSRRAYAGLAQTPYAAVSLMALGVIDIEYKRLDFLYYLDNF